MPTNFENKPNGPAKTGNGAARSNAESAGNGGANGVTAGQVFGGAVWKARHPGPGVVLSRRSFGEHRDHFGPIATCAQDPGDREHRVVQMRRNDDQPLDPELFQPGPHLRCMGQAGHVRSSAASQSRWR